jgi:hypothetical protein
LHNVLVDVRSAARERTQEAIDTLAEIMNDKGVSASARILAAQGILDRGYGKPQQVTSHPNEAEPWDLTKLTDEELGALDQMASRATRPPQEH